MVGTPASPAQPTLDMLNGDAWSRDDISRGARLRDRRRLRDRGTCRRSARLRRRKSAWHVRARRHILIAVTRYLAAHSPTERSWLQTATIAERLARGDQLYENV